MRMSRAQRRKLKNQEKKQREAARQVRMCVPCLDTPVMLTLSCTRRRQSWRTMR